MQASGLLTDRDRVDAYQKAVMEEVSRQAVRSYYIQTIGITACMRGQGRIQKVLTWAAVMNL